MVEKVKDTEMGLGMQALLNMRKRVKDMEDDPGRFSVEYVNDLIAGANALEAEMSLTYLLIERVSDLRREGLESLPSLKPLDPATIERLFSDEEIAEFRQQSTVGSDSARLMNLEAWQATVEQRLEDLECSVFPPKEVMDSPDTRIEHPGDSL